MTVRRGARAALLGGGAAVVVAVGACGSRDLEQAPPPPAPVELSGVISAERVTISPNRVGAGPVLMTVSNQADASHTITLEGRDIRERVGPINPAETATIEKDLRPGTYEVRAGSARALPRPIAPARLMVAPVRPSVRDRPDTPMSDRVGDPSVGK